MSTDGTSGCNADLLAQNLFGTLSNGAPALPAVDLAAVHLDLPSTTDNPLYEAMPSLTNADLTDGHVDGSGLFDVLMASFKSHLEQEYKSNRMNGAEYAKAYVALTTAALSTASGFLLQRETARQQAILVREQAKAAEVMAITARVNHETAKAQLAAAHSQALLTSSQLALSKLQLATQDAQYCLVKANVAQTEYQTTTIMPAQLAQVQAETSRLGYELTDIMPKQADLLVQQKLAAIENTAETVARRDGILYQNASILPAQHVGLQKDNAIKEYQVTYVLPAQVENMTEDTAGKDYNTRFILPAQLANIKEQTESHRAKTLDTRSDGAVVKGAIGKQMALHDQQIDSYKQDAQWKVTKGILDTWITQKSLDEGLPPPSSLNDSSINTAMSKMRTSVDL